MAVGLSVAVLARSAGLKKIAVEQFEVGEDLPAEIRDELQRALEAAGVEFSADGGNTGGVRLRNATQ